MISVAMRSLRLKLRQKMNVNEQESEEDHQQEKLMKNLTRDKLKKDYRQNN